MLKHELTTKNEQWRKWTTWWETKKAKPASVESPLGSIDELSPPDEHIDRDDGRTKVDDEGNAMDLDEVNKSEETGVKNATNLEHLGAGEHLTGIATYVVRHADRSR